MENHIKVLISGGGTGGHIFPAISIANAIKAKIPDADILFVGAENRMEMEKVPAAGYNIIGLPVCGFDRKNVLKNCKVVVKLLQSINKARKTVKRFQPDIAVGVGGYASGPTLWAAAHMEIPTVIQEQNSYAGVTNKLLASKAKKICVAYDNMEKFFPKEKIVITGTFEKYKRKDLEDIFSQNGLVVQSAVAKSTDFLVVGEKAGSKLKKAQELGIEIITEDVLESFLERIR